LSQFLKTEVEKVIAEFNTVFRYGLVGPLSILALTREYDYLLLWKEYDYFVSIDRLTEMEEFDCLFDEYSLLR
jgi:hypothetical protein